MKRIYRSVAEITQPHANNIRDIVQAHFRANGVRRAADLSDEAAIRMNQDIRSYRRTEMDGGPRVMTRSESWQQAKRNFVSQLLAMLVIAAGVGMIVFVAGLCMVYVSYILGKH